MKKMCNNDTFVKITNKDIFNKIEELIKTNDKDHDEIISHQMRTNGKVKLNRWIATTALSLAFIVVGWVANNFIGG